MFPFFENFYFGLYFKECISFRNCFQCIEQPGCGYCAVTSTCEAIKKSDCAQISQECPMLNSRLIFGSVVVLIGGIFSSGVGLGGGPICKSKYAPFHF